MDLYRKYILEIHAEDQEKADEILELHWKRGDLANMGHVSQPNREGSSTITYWIRPYIYEDFQSIVEEFKEAGIRII